MPQNTCNHEHKTTLQPGNDYEIHRCLLCGRYIVTDTSGPKPYTFLTPFETLADAFDFATRRGVREWHKSGWIDDALRGR